MPTITAAVAREQGKPLTLEQLELDDIRPDEARVRMVATGICHTDAIVRDGVYPTPLPAVLGHEGAGIVEAVGADVTGARPGAWRTARTCSPRTSAAGGPTGPPPCRTPAAPRSPRTSSASHRSAATP